MKKSILDYLEIHDAGRPDAPFITDGDNVISFREYFSLVRRVAFFLREKGVRKGDRLLIYLAGRVNHSVAYFAGMSIGAIPVHVYPERPLNYLAYAAEMSGAVAVIVDRDMSLWTAQGCRALAFPDTNSFTSELWVKDIVEPAYMMFTSGTSGKPPKAVMTTHENILFVTETIMDFLGMEEGDKELNFMPLGSTGGLGHLHCGLQKGFHSLFFQCSLLESSSSVFVDMLKTIREQGVTGFLGTPGLLHKLVHNHREDFRKSMKNVRYAVSNVHPCPVELIEELFVLAPSTRFHTYYGLTEASRSVNHCYNDNPAHLTAAGKPSKGVFIRVHHSDSKTGLGEICIKGPNLMSGYWGLSTKPFDDEGWFHTGDLGYMDDKGFVYIKGRIDSLINVGGMKFYPDEVEKLLESDKNVVKAAVVGVHATETYQRVVAAIETSSETFDENELRQRLNLLCEEKLEYFKVPTEFVFLPELPRTDLGKVKYPEIVKLFSHG